MTTKFKKGDRFIVGAASGEIMDVTTIPSGEPLYEVWWDHFSGRNFYIAAHVDDLWEKESTPAPLKIDPRTPSLPGGLYSYRVQNVEPPRTPGYVHSIALDFDPHKCEHQSKTYLGLAETYNYCTKCNERLP